MKSKTLTVSIAVPARRRQVKKDLPPKLFRKLERVLAAEIKSKRKHFKRDKWDLSWRIIEGNIYQDVFGSALEWYVMGRLLEAGDQFVWNPKTLEFMLRRDPIKRRKRVRK